MSICSNLPNEKTDEYFKTEPIIDYSIIDGMEMDLNRV